MKTISLKSVIILIAISLFSISLFANGLSFRVRLYDVNPLYVTEKIKSEIKIFQHEKDIDIGAFEDYFTAMKFQYKLEELGFPKTAIVSDFNQDEIPLDDAFALLDNRNRQDEEMIKPMSEVEMDLALKMVQNEDFYYSIQIGVFSEEAVNKFFEFPKQIDETITAKGYYRYTYGRFYTYQDAKDALAMLQKNYFEKAFIIAFDELERIPITAAMNKEKRLLEESVAAIAP